MTKISSTSVSMVASNKLAGTVNGTPEGSETEVLELMAKAQPYEYARKLCHAM